MAALLMHDPNGGAGGRAPRRHTVSRPVAPRAPALSLHRVPHAPVRTVLPRTPDGASWHDAICEHDGAALSGSHYRSIARSLLLRGEDGIRRRRRRRCVVALVVAVAAVIAAGVVAAAAVVVAAIASLISRARTAAGKVAASSWLPPASAASLPPSASRHYAVLSNLLTAGCATVVPFATVFVPLSFASPRAPTFSSARLHARPVPTRGCLWVHAPLRWTAKLPRFPLFASPLATQPFFRAPPSIASPMPQLRPSPVPVLTCSAQPAGGPVRRGLSGAHERSARTPHPQPSATAMDGHLASVPYCSCHPGCVSLRYRGCAKRAQRGAF